MNEYCNWCKTVYLVKGNKKEIKKIKDVIFTLMKKDIFDEEKLVEALKGDPDYYSLFGYIEACYMGGKETELWIEAEEEWSPSDLRQFLFDSFNVEIFYMAKEPSMRLFRTNDKRGKYFPERYAVYDKDDNVWFAIKKEEAKVIEEEIPKTEQPQIEKVQFIM